MATWSDLQFAFEEVLTASKLNNMDENFDALAEGAAGAPAIQTAALSTDFTGHIIIYGGSGEPSGYLQCNGQAVSRTTFSALFNVIGTTYGTGDGSTTFNVPDLRDRSPLGENTMGASDAGRVGTDTTALGDSGGSDTHTLTTSEMPSHTHGGTTDNSTVNSRQREVIGDNSISADRGQTVIADDDGTNVLTNTLNQSSHSHSFTTNSTGGGGAHNTMHPFLVVNFIIKT